MIRLMLLVTFQEFLNERETRFESRMSFDRSKFLHRNLISSGLNGDSESSRTLMATSRLRE